MRDYSLYLNDIVDSINKIQNYTKGYSFEDFFMDIKTCDAVIRNLEIIGETSKCLPKKIIILTPDIDWQAVKGMRNIIAHEYFGVDLKIIWKTITQKLPEMKEILIRTGYINK